MFIYIGCAGGGTSSLFCSRMVKEITRHDENLTATFDDIETVLKNQKALGSNFDLVFAYGAASRIKSFNAFDFGNLFDAILIAPQVSFLLPQIQALMAKFPTQVRDLPGKLFGTMDGERGFDLLLELLIELDLWRGYTSSQLSSTKGADKDVEIYVAGASPKDLYWKTVFAFLENRGVRACVTGYSLEKLYDFHPDEDFDVRFIFGTLSVLTEEDFARVARRIDGILVNSSAVAALKKRKPWLEAYDIAYQKFDDTNAKKDIKKGRFGPQEELIWDFLEKVEQKCEYTTEISVDKFETAELAVRKQFGFLSWS